MFEAFAARHNRNRTAVWIAVCCILSAAAAIEGISDNLPGILLAFGAAIALVLAFVHPLAKCDEVQELTVRIGSCPRGVRSSSQCV